MHSIMLQQMVIYTEIVRLLLNAGSPYSDCNKWALDYASAKGHIKIVELLLEAKKDCTEDLLDFSSR